jgi:hypothetical protein
MTSRHRKGERDATREEVADRNLFIEHWTKYHRPGSTPELAGRLADLLSGSSEHFRKEIGKWSQGFDSVTD